MGVFYGPTTKVVPVPTVYLDAALTSSYSGSGTTWTDISGNGNDFTLYGTPTFASGAFTLNGSSQYIKRIVGTKTSFDFGTGDFTVEFWTKPIATAVTSGIWYQSGFAESYYISSTYTNYYAIGPATGSTLYTTGWGTLATTSWYQLVASRISGTTYLYKNATLSTSGTDTTNYTHADSNYIILGALYGTPSNYYNGYYSVLKVYKGKGLTSTEVTANFNLLKSRYGL